ncbi:MAG: hypothetical protein QGH40_13370 [bacterium]|jgi:uncharacterized protein HemY|nr:hypothetical protein [bacterium]
MYDKVRKHFEQGMMFFNKGQYQQALGEFTAAKEVFLKETN